MQRAISWKDYANSPQEFMAKLNKAKMTLATPEEMKKGIAAHFDIRPLPKK
jgi:hypothetical protein